MLSNEKMYLIWQFTLKISVVITSTELVLLTVTNLLPLLFVGLFSIVVHSFAHQNGML